MNYFKDFYNWHLTISKRYWLRELIRIRNYTDIMKWRRQRIDRGFSDRDTWGAGDYIAQVCAGILYKLHKTAYTDWDEYFSTNYPDNHGYSSLEEVADDLRLYLDWQVLQYEEPYYKELQKEDIEIRIALEHQTYEQAKNAMHFVASNLGSLWD